MKRLIVTADDFGASLGVNEAVERAHREGVLTAASLMIGAPEAQDAIGRARRMPQLGIGLHVALTNAHPVLAPQRVPDLVNARGEFDANLVRAGVRYFFLPRVRRQLEAEIRAQFEAFAATGLVLDHADAHNHIHVHPTLFALILKVGRDYGLRAMRIPSEPANASWSGIGNALLIGPWAALMRTRLRSAGIIANDALFGLNDTGRLSERRVIEIVTALPDGLSELYLHPVVHERNAMPSTAKDSTTAYAREEELEVLLGTSMRDVITAKGIQLVRYADAPT